MLAGKPFIGEVREGSVKSEFDTIDARDTGYGLGEFRRLGLDAYDHGNYDEPDSWLDIALSRWGDLRTPRDLSHPMDRHNRA